MARSWPTFRPKKSPTNRRFISAKRSEPEYLKEVRAFRLDGIAGHPGPRRRDLKTLLAWPTIASKNWVYRQYDHMVRDGSVVCPGSDAAVLRIKADSLPAPAPTRRTPPAPGKIHRPDGGWQRRLRLSRSLRRRQNRRGRSGPQSGLFRRRAAGRDRQSQLRQPAQAGIVLAAQGIRARPGRSLPGVQRAGHRRQLLASTTKAPTARLIPTPDGRRGRPDRKAGAHHDAMVQGRRRRDHPAGRHCGHRPIRCSVWAARLICKLIHGLKTGTPPRCDLENERGHCTPRCSA